MVNFKGLTERLKGAPMHKVGGRCPVCGNTQGTAMHGQLHAQYLREHQPQQTQPATTPKTLPPNFNLSNRIK